MTTPILTALVFTALAVAPQSLTGTSSDVVTHPQLSIRSDSLRDKSILLTDSRMAYPIDVFRRFLNGVPSRNLVAFSHATSGALSTGRASTSCRTAVTGPSRWLLRVRVKRLRGIYRQPVVVPGAVQEGTDDMASRPLRSAQQYNGASARQSRSTE